MNHIFFTYQGEFLGEPIHIVLTGWKIFGLAGGILFTARWIVQVYYSHKAGKPVIPLMYWVMSVVGSVMLLSYFTFSPKQDMVGIVTNLFPSVIAGYNLYLDLTHRRRERIAQLTPVAAAHLVNATEKAVIE
jgi:lipid-A-disaccharide synthase-like uncharacterized protein